MFMKAVIEYLKKIIKKDYTVIIGCSGGSDSMGLLYLIKENFKENQIVCAHINHKVRKQSDKEYKYVKSFCDKNNIIFEGMEITQIFNNNFEAEARKIRYEFYERLFQKYNAKFIMTAHHADDLIETILMRISRGSNLSGYAGIKLLDGKYLRPLLLVDKKTILKYVKTKKIRYYEDYTNRLNVHTRNRYRHKVLPFLKKESSKVSEKYLKFSNELQEYDNFVTDYIKEKEIINDLKINVEKFLKETDFIQKKVLEILIKEIQKENFIEVSDKNVENMLNIMKSSKSNSIVTLSNGFIGKKSYNCFTIIKPIINQDFELVFDESFETEKWIINKVSTSSSTSNWVLRLNSKELEMPLKIRNRRNGDIMFVKNLGAKKLKNIFIDEKVDVNERYSYPIIVDSSGKILWIPGLKKSEFDKAKNEKYDIILYSERKWTDE